MKSLIIGGSGFVGAYLAQYLIRLGHEVLVTGKYVRRHLIPGIPAYKLDVLKKKDVAAFMQEVKPDFVYHLAAQSSVAVSWADPIQTVDVNIKGSINILDAVRESGKTPRILLIGSSEEYGRIPLEEVPVGEDARVRPENIYAATKACQNMIGRIYAQAYGMDIVMVRAFNHIGPKQDPLFVTADFCKQAVEIEAGKREAVIKVGNLEAKRDFTDVRDIVRAYAALAEKGRTGETYNVGSGHAVSIGEVLQIILDQVSASIRIETDPKRFRPLDTPVIEADISKMQKITGWIPMIRLDQTIQDTLDDWRKLGGRDCADGKF